MDFIYFKANKIYKYIKVNKKQLKKKVAII